jgi:hypothetical protein
MSFMVYLAVLIATVFSIALEWDTLVEHPPVAYHAVQAQAPVSAPPAAPVVHEATPEQPARSNASASAPVAPPPPPAPAETAAQPSVQCDVDACSAAYRTFRASDCTYNSSSGRRLCTKGTAENDSVDTRTEPGVANCHVRACSEHYSSFNPSDCTYQPLEGPRRLCEK